MAILYHFMVSDCQLWPMGVPNCWEFHTISESAKGRGVGLEAPGPDPPEFLQAAYMVWDF